MKNILIADSHSLARVGLAYLIQQSLGESRIEMAQDMEMLRRHLNSRIFDLMVLDIDIAGTEYTGLVNEIVRLQPKVKILVFTKGQNKPFKIIHLVDRLVGYIEKEAALEEVADALRVIASNGVYFKHKQFEILFDSNVVKSNSSFAQLDTFLRKLLSEREYEVTRMLVAGVAVKEIARMLDIKLTTVSTYQKRIFNKTAINNSGELIALLQATNFKDTVLCDVS